MSKRESFTGFNLTKILFIFFTLLSLTLSSLYTSNIKADAQTSAVPTLSYCVHAQTYGWLDSVSDNVITGTTGEAKRLEALAITVHTNGATASDGSALYGSIVCKAHVQTLGWMDEIEFPASDKSATDLAKAGTYAGTSGQAKRVEAIRLSLTGNLADEYDILYRVHVQTYGWLNWVKNGDIAGTTGESKRLEAIQIKLVKKQDTTASITYQVHAQTYSWMDPVTAAANEVSNSTICGTVGKSKRLEAIKIKLNTNGLNGSVTYKTHVQTYGWMDACSDGAISGTEGQSKRMEAISINLEGDISAYYDIYYRVHIQSYGWLDWAKNGAYAGSSGGAKRMEAIQIVLVTKGGAAPGDTDTPFKKLTQEVDYSSIPGNFSIMINKQQNTVTIYKGGVAVKAMVCSTGDDTPLGSYSLGEKYRWHNLFYNCWGQYCYRITGHILFHSVPYHTANAYDLESEEFNKLGTSASAGCIRLCVRDAKWIYDNCPSGTSVIIYNDSNPGPLGKPEMQKIPVSQTYDPTDTFQ